MNFTKCIVNQLPNGKWGFVGRVPVELHEQIRPASKEAIMAGRCGHDANGDTVEFRSMVFDTEEDAQSALDNWLD